MYYVIPLTLLYTTVAVAQRLGEVHTSVAQLSKLVNAENKIVVILERYLKQEQKRLQIIKRYVDDWQGVTEEDVVGNPLNSYHFLTRIAEDFKEIEHILLHENSQKVQEAIKKAKLHLHIPMEPDINGAAWSIVKLQEVYNLSIDEMILGIFSGIQSHKGLTAKDCFRFGEQGFKNLEFDLSDLWTQQGIDMISSKENITVKDVKRMKSIEGIVHQRNLMRKLVTEIARKSSDEVVDHFSGLGIPTSFQKVIHHKDENAKSQIDVIEKGYTRLCRGENIHELEYYKGLSCSYLTARKSFYRLLMPFKIELIWPDPIIVIYHDVLSDKEMKILRDLAYPNLETTQVHSFTNHAPLKSLARVGKTAWVGRGVSSQVDKILKRIEHMTGLSTTFAEDFHILNYGIGGHYDVHVDFFDLRSKNMSPDAHNGDRITTALFYLNEVEAGGATVFPTLGLSVPPEKGAVLLWFNLKRNGEGDYRTVHASCPVLLGQKWIANLWLHEFGQEFIWPCKLDPDE